MNSNNQVSKKLVSTSEYSDFNKKLYLYKNTKWVSFSTYIMTVENFSYVESAKRYFPLLNTSEYQSETCIVNASYNNEIYMIEDKELYKNVSIKDKIVVTIKYSYDKDDNLIHTNIHHCHPYPLTYD